MSLVAWVRSPTESFPISENLIVVVGADGSCGLSISLNTTVGCSVTFASPESYFPDTDYGGHTYQYLRGNAFATSSGFSGGAANKWFLVQSSLSNSGGNLGSGATYGGYGKVSYAVNVTSLSTVASYSTITGLYWDGAQWLSHIFPWADFGTWPIGLNGGTLTFPSQVGKKIEFGDIYVWTSFIDFNNDNNKTKFIRVAAGLAYPADPAIPIAAFGTPAIHFRGKASDNSFFFNRGSLGSFAKVGTASDFTPAPSY